MTIDGAIARFQRRTQDLFRDEATVSRRPTTAGTISTSDSVLTPAATTETYSGPCQLRAFAWQGNDSRYGDSPIRLRQLRAKFPPDTDIVYNDIVVPTASTYDESLVGVSFRVTDSFRDGWQIARVVILEEITR